MFMATCYIVLVTTCNKQQVLEQVKQILNIRGNVQIVTERFYDNKHGTRLG